MITIIISNDKCAPFAYIFAGVTKQSMAGQRPHEIRPMDLPIPPLIQVAIALLAFSILAGWMDYRRGKREHLDKVGWVNWPLVMMLALIGAVMTLLLGLGL